MCMCERVRGVMLSVSCCVFIPDVFQKILSQFGGVDIFCNNAGIADEKNWEKTVSINLVGHCVCNFILFQTGASVKDPDISLACVCVY